jgi:hypothetical protein
LNHPRAEKHRIIIWMKDGVEGLKESYLPINFKIQYSLSLFLDSVAEFTSPRGERIVDCVPSLRKELDSIWLELELLDFIFALWHAWQSNKMDCLPS